MNATELYRAGKLDEAIDSLGAALRSDPTDARRRTFLFELLCFAGQYDRAEKQLDVLAAGGAEADMGALLYRAALHAERVRQNMWRAGEPPQAAPAPQPVPGKLNGEAFERITDADPRIGARLEVFAAGQYTWLPFQHLERVTVAAPTRLRDLLWAPAIVRTGPTFSGLEIGEVLVPVLTPLVSQNSDPDLRLGRKTDWVLTEGGQEVPVGQKMLLVDGQEFPILEVRELLFGEGES